ncbi:metalloregulator ArsR/SmtB family transcription factor [Lachnospiraceae bacterium OttesenSCG-928-D06]|nr:metalloregulator ArsR/SmtB family transcription factor [Lachnospiraceae bacterium OttesenSCG-928-D06]
MEEKAKQVAELLKILSNENRLLILCALQNGKMNVGEIANHVLGITQPALSQHLALLKTAGILESDKQGMNVVYSIADIRVKELLNTLRDYYCD